MTLLVSHPERNIIHVQLRQNVVLKTMTDAERAELEQRLVVVDCAKEEYLLHQGVHEMEQYFVLDGILKRVVANADAKEMILRFADERDIETSYAAWRLNTPTPYAIVSVTKARVAKLPMPVWVDFIGRQTSSGSHRRRSELPHSRKRCMNMRLAAVWKSSALPMPSASR